nr:hypothetical protein [uncultured Niameybacter sp.]
MDKYITNRLFRNCYQFLITLSFLWLFKVEDTFIETIELTIWIFICTKIVKVILYVVEKMVIKYKSLVKYKKI